MRFMFDYALLSQIVSKIFILIVYFFLKSDKIKVDYTWKIFLNFFNLEPDEEIHLIELRREFTILAIGTTFIAVVSLGKISKFSFCFYSF